MSLKPTPLPVRHNFFQKKQKLHRGVCSEASGMTVRAAGADVPVGGRAGEQRDGRRVPSRAVVPRRLHVVCSVSGTQRMSNMERHGVHTRVPSDQ